MKVELEIKPGDFTGWIKRVLTALHSWAALLITAGGFLAAAVLFSGWDFSTKLVCWALILGAASGIRGMCQSEEQSRLEREEARRNR